MSFLKKTRLKFLKTGRRGLVWMLFLFLEASPFLFPPGTVVFEEPEAQILQNRPPRLGLDAFPFPGSFSFPFPSRDCRF